MMAKRSHAASHAHIHSHTHVCGSGGSELTPGDASLFIFHILANCVNKENISCHRTYFKAKSSKVFGPQRFL